MCPASVPLILLIGKPVKRNVSYVCLQSGNAQALGLWRLPGQVFVSDLE